jgi:hypothetical protein
MIFAVGGRFDWARLTGAAGPRRSSGAKIAPVWGLDRPHPWEGGSSGLPAPARRPLSRLSRGPAPAVRKPRVRPRGSARSALPPAG